MERQQVDFICSNCLLVNASTGSTDMLAWGSVTGNPKSGFRRRLLEDNFVPPNSTLVRRRVFERVGTFDTSLKGVDDYDLWYRIAREVPCSVLTKPLCTWRYQNSSSISADQSLMLEDELVFYQKLLALPDVTEEEREVGMEHSKRNRRRLGNQALQAGAYQQAAAAYREADASLLVALTLAAGPLLKAGYAAKRRTVPQFSPINLDFSL